MSTPRASIFDESDLDVTAFAPKLGPDRSAPAPAAVRAVAEAAHFRSREAGTGATDPTIPAVATEAVKRQTRRYRTGRNIQFNIKVSQQAIDTFYAISDRQKWVLGETLEHALAALEKMLEQGTKAEAR